MRIPDADARRNPVREKSWLFVKVSGKPNGSVIVVSEYAPCDWDA
jgi:hypothetical protein